MFETKALLNFMPSKWSKKMCKNEDHTLVQINKSSSEYRKYSSQITGTCNGGIMKIERVQNPFLYCQFLLKQEEYKSRNIKFAVKELFHDTATANVESIVSNNFDWRLTKRAKFGLGVSFSPSPAYANKQSSCKNGNDRAMIVVDVLVGKEEMGHERQSLPRHGDTTTGNKRKVYVKYFDYEFYPKYVVYYKNISINLKNITIKKPKAQKNNRPSPTDNNASTSNDYFYLLSVITTKSKQLNLLNK